LLLDFCSWIAAWPHGLVMNVFGIKAALAAHFLDAARRLWSDFADNFVGHSSCLSVVVKRCDARRRFAGLKVASATIGSSTLLCSERCCGGYLALTVG
jgi:hypothetical protein